MKLATLPVARQTKAKKVTAKMMSREAADDYT